MITATVTVGEVKALYDTLKEGNDYEALLAAIELGFQKGLEVRHEAERSD